MSCIDIEVPDLDTLHSTEEINVGEPAVYLQTYDKPVDRPLERRPDQKNLAELRVKLHRIDNRSVKLEEKYPCKGCGESYKFERDLWAHKYYECKIQKPDTNTKNKEIREPSKVKSTKSYNKHVCNLCSKTYTHKGALTRHVRYECQKIPQFKCEYCSYQCKRKEHLLIHLWNVHEKDESPKFEFLDLPEYTTSFDYPTMDPLLHGESLDQLYFEDSGLIASVDLREEHAYCLYENPQEPNTKKLLSRNNQEVGNSEGVTLQKSTVTLERLSFHSVFHDEVLNQPPSKRKRLVKRRRRGLYTKKTYTCDQCGRKYLHKGSLTAHKTFECNQERRFSCDLCSYRSKQKVHMKRHICNVHGRNRHFEAPSSMKNRQKHMHNCDQCGNSYANKFSLLKHQKYVCCIKPYRCYHCRYKSKRKSLLRKHIWRSHEKDGIFVDKFDRYECEHCKRKSKRKEYLTSHIFSAHGKALNLIMDNECDRCGKKYANKGNLDRHTKYECIYSNVPPRFSCPFCLYRSKQKWAMHNHVRRIHKKYVKK